MEWIGLGCVSVSDICAQSDGNVCYLKAWKFLVAKRVLSSQIKSPRSALLPSSSRLARRCAQDTNTSLRDEFLFPEVAVKLRKFL